MNEGAGYKGVPTTSYKSYNNPALQTILGDDNGTLIIGRGLLICTNCTTYSFAKLDRQMFDVCSKRSALEATGRQLLLFLLVQSWDK